MNTKIILLFIPAVIALFAVRMVYFKILYLAKIKHLVDNPDARKLQKQPIPVMGGLAVYMGVLAGLGTACCFTSITTIVPIFIAAGLMIYLGILDDNIGLKPISRLILESATILILILGSNSCVDNLYGIWGIHQFSWYIGVPLTIFAGVGIINAVNMIDGVNGLSSLLCIMCCALFGFAFYKSDDLPNMMLAFIMVFAIIPFLIHNVFGKESRMFIGDAGTMMMGTTLAWFVIQTLSTKETSEELCITLCNQVAMTLSILIVPIFDTLRVMTLRMYHGRSPFSADKTHLHHAFIGCGFSHSATAVFENLIGFICFLVCYYSNQVFHLYSSTQLYIVVAYGVIFVWGTYFFLVRAKENNKVQSVAVHTNYDRKGWWLYLQNLLDAPEYKGETIDHESLSKKIDDKFRN